MVSANSVTGNIITSLAKIADGTGSVGVIYNPTAHQIRIVIAPADGYAFGAASAYSTVTAALNEKLATIVNTVEPSYTVRSGNPTAGFNPNALSGC